MYNVYCLYLYQYKKCACLATYAITSRILLPLQNCLYTYSTYVNTSVCIFQIICAEFTGVFVAGCRLNVQVLIKTHLTENSTFKYVTHKVKDGHNSNNFCGTAFKMYPKCDKELTPTLTYCDKELTPTLTYCDKKLTPTLTYCDKELTPTLTYCDKELTPTLTYCDKEPTPTLAYCDEAPTPTLTHCIADRNSLSRLVCTFLFLYI